MPKCWRCGDRVRTIKKCKNCLKAIYCDKECQTLDWRATPSHKVLCEKIQTSQRNQEAGQKYLEEHREEHDKIIAKFEQERSQKSREERIAIARSILETLACHAPDLDLKMFHYTPNDREWYT